MTQPPSPHDHSGIDPDRLAQHYAAQRRANAANSASEQKTTTELRQEISRAVTDDEKEALKEALDTIRMREREEADRLAEFNRQTTMIMLLGGNAMSNQFADLLEMKSKAITNMASELGVSLPEAQRRVDDLLSSGLTQDAAEVMKWGSKNDPEIDAAKKLDGAPVVARIPVAPKQQHQDAREQENPFEYTPRLEPRPRRQR